MEKDMQKTLLRLGESIDALVAPDHTARGIANELYACVRHPGQPPLCMNGAMMLRKQLAPGDRVMIFTGWPSRSWLMRGITETDGPVGAALMARSLEEAYGVIPILVMEKSLLHFGETALRAAGLIVSDLETALKSKLGPPKASVGAVVSLTADVGQAVTESASMLDRIKPGALIAIELPGANREYKYHNVTGREVPDEIVMKADETFRLARERGILTIGIGDGGNELGMANALPAIERYLNNGAEIAPVTPVDHLITSCISNWGALGLAACIYAVAGMPQAFSHLDICRITRCVTDDGAIDGLTAYVDPMNDGTPQEVNAGLSSLLAMTLRMHLGGWNKK